MQCVTPVHLEPLIISCASVLKLGPAVIPWGDRSAHLDLLPSLCLCLQCPHLWHSLFAPVDSQGSRATARATTTRGYTFFLSFGRFLEMSCHETKAVSYLLLPHLWKSCFPPNIYKHNLASQGQKVKLFLVGFLVCSISKWWISRGFTSIQDMSSSSRVPLLDLRPTDQRRQMDWILATLTSFSCHLQLEAQFCLTLGCCERMLLTVPRAGFL